VGTLTILLEGMPIGTTTLVAKSSVRQSSAGQLLLFLEKTLTSKFFIISMLITLPISLFRIYLKIKRKPQKRR
jgi:hypothetical protein